MRANADKLRSVCPICHTVHDTTECPPAALTRPESQQAGRGDVEPCDHDWKQVDASFDHEYGVEQIFYMECQTCGATKECEPRSPEDDL
jgi:hypothetical protein